MWFLRWRSSQATPPAGSHRKLLKKVYDVELLSKFVWEGSQCAVMSAGPTTPSITDTAMTTKNVPLVTDGPTLSMHKTDIAYQ